MGFRFPNCNNLYCASVQQLNNLFENSEQFNANCWIIQEVILFFKASKIVVVDTRY